MKKTLAAAITSALVIGVASTTFAAANPFSDVPTDHWSFDAVARLAQEGVIEGYGDNTFRGDAHITRYEMAQMVAKAMAKSGLGSADKTTIDRLAAEYADELSTLGVRVANLEKKSDNVKFNGELRFRFDDFSDNWGDSRSKALFRLEPTAQINDEWVAKARLEWEQDMEDSGNGESVIDRAYAQGPLFGATAKLGKLPSYSEQGYVLDDPLSGAEFQWKGEKLTTTLTGGRIGDEVHGWERGNVTDSDTVDYYALDLKYAVTPQTNIDLAYHHLNSELAFEQDNAVNEDTNDIWTFGFDTKFNDTVGLKAIYAQSSLDVDKDNGYSVEVGYKGAQPVNAGSFGLWAAYRSVPTATAISSTWDGAITGKKGYELGAQYTVAKNILATAVYFDGEDVGEDSKNDGKHFRGQVEFFF